MKTDSEILQRKYKITSYQADIMVKEGIIKPTALRALSIADEYAARVKKQPSREAIIDISVRRGVSVETVYKDLARLRVTLCKKVARPSNNKS